jgi:hypothetical protein
VTDPAGVQVGHAHDKLRGDGPRRLNGKQEVCRVFLGCSDAAGARFLHKAGMTSVGPLERKPVEESGDKLLPLVGPAMATREQFQNGGFVTFG